VPASQTYKEKTALGKIAKNKKPKTVKKLLAAFGENITL